MAEDQNVTLELLLNKATNPALREEDWEAIVSFTDQVNKELEGPQIAVRLLAHKIQSPTERESLHALACLEACVKNCGRTFHQEIGKFRFLNEIIKVVSPKYLGNKMTEKVKKRCVELMYSWYRGLPHEGKVGEAYKMLKSQGIVKEDPTYMDKTFDPFPPPKPRRAEFEDEEKAKTLSRLLKSKNPDDLQAANRLIKNMVKEDAEKSEKRSRRINELEAITNQVKLLIEMVTHYTQTSSRSDIDVMKELYESLEKQRPKLFRLASETEEHETDAINDILKVNDSVTRAMSMYMQRVQGVADENGVADSGPKDSSLLDLGFDSSPAHQPQSKAEPASGATALLQSEFQNLGLGDAQPLGGIFSSQTMAAPGAGGMPTQPGMMGGMRPPGIGQTMPAFSMHQPTPFSSQQQQLSSLAFTQTSVFGGPRQQLQQLRLPPQLQPQVLGPWLIWTLSASRCWRKTERKTLYLHLLVSNANTNNIGQAAPSSAASNDDNMFTDMVSAPAPPPPAPTQELLPLTDVFVPLEDIKPAEDVSPVTAYDKNGLKSMIHFSTNRPRPDVLVMVLSTLSTNSKPVKNFMFQAAVPKIMKVKLQPPSATDLPAYNPILPPAAITQVLLIANPRK
ncbi:hypothetical protein BaRGS_00007273, partial [Batillaria attramentaria]